MLRPMLSIGSFSEKPKLTFWLFLFFITTLRVVWLYVTPYDLYIDEAQYWIWSKNLDFGYYSKPPMIAWIIAFFTKLLGDTPFIIRLASPFLHAATALVIYQITTKLYSERAALFSGISYATMPAVFLSSALISTDAPLLLIWSCALLFFIRAHEDDKLFDWCALGIIFGLGMLTKYNMAIFAISAFIYTIIYRRDLLFNGKVWLAVLIAIILWAPNVAWNLNNNMASFNHTAELAGSNFNTIFNPLKGLEFLASQIAVAGPILLALIVKSQLRGNSHFLKIFTIPFFAIILSIAFTARAHANWAAPAYIAALILCVGYISSSKYERYLKLSIGFNTTLGILALIYATLLANGLIASTPQTDIFKRTRGAKEVGIFIDKILKDYPDATLVADNRVDYTRFAFYSKVARGNILKLGSSKYINDHFDLCCGTWLKRPDIMLLVTRQYQPEDIHSREPVKVVAEFTYEPYQGFPPMHYRALLVKSPYFLD